MNGRIIFDYALKNGRAADCSVWRAFALAQSGATDAC
jgi:hypothetical protein